MFQIPAPNKHPTTYFISDGRGMYPNGGKSIGLGSQTG